MNKEETKKRMQLLIDWWIEHNMPGYYKKENMYKQAKRIARIWLLAKGTMLLLVVGIVVTQFTREECYIVIPFGLACVGLIWICFLFPPKHQRIIITRFILDTIGLYSLCDKKLYDYPAIDDEYPGMKSGESDHAGTVCAQLAWTGLRKVAKELSVLQVELQAAAQARREGSKFISTNAIKGKERKLHRELDNGIRFMMQFDLLVGDSFEDVKVKTKRACFANLAPDGLPWPE